MCDSSFSEDLGFGEQGYGVAFLFFFLFFFNEALWANLLRVIGYYRFGREKT